MPKADRQIKGVLVRIFGDEYRISSHADPGDVEQIARYVDEKMQAIAAQHPGRVAKTTLAVLTAMEITSELFDAMREQNELTETAQENLQRLSRLVDERADIFSSLPRQTQSYNGRPQEMPVQRRKADPAE